MARRKEKRPESVSGGYSAIPWVVLDSVSFMGASDKAKSLLFALMRQHNGSNNGRLHLAKGWLNKHGWKYDTGNLNARNELIERGLIVQTKYGGLNMGAHFFALTWLDITNYVGLDIEPRGYRKGAYSLCNLDPTKRRKQPVKKSELIDHRASAVSTIDSEQLRAVSTIDSEKRLFIKSTVSTIEHNVITPLPTNNLIKRFDSASA